MGQNRADRGLREQRRTQQPTPCCWALHYLCIQYTFNMDLKDLYIHFRTQGKVHKRTLFGSQDSTCQTFLCNSVEAEKLPILLILLLVSLAPVFSSE